MYAASRFGALSLYFQDGRRCLEGVPPYNVSSASFYASLAHAFHFICFNKPPHPIDEGLRYARRSLATSPRAIPSIPNLTIAIDGAQDASSRRDAPSSILDGEATRAPMFTALTQFFHCTAVHRIPRRLFRCDFRPCTRHFGGIVSGESQIARNSSRCDATRKMLFRERKKKRPHSLHCP